MPDIHLDDTIAAVATPPGEGAIGIVRLSGPEAVRIAGRMFRKKSGRPFSLEQAKTHTVHFGTICDEQGGAIDQALVTVFRKPSSYTAEDAVEISAHGGIRILRNILNLALSYGARQAEPGEFTRRAFLNGRIDLTQAEAVTDLIRAKTDRSLDAARRQLDGTLSGEIHVIKDSLMKLYAHLEAYLDFPDEHLEVYSSADFQRKFQDAQDRLKRLIASFSKGEILREGAVVVIAGRANVGKSSLLNALLDRDRALVSEIPGTTRDTLEESIELNGIRLRLVDTAGLGASANPLDQAAMERTRRAFQDGDLFLWVVDGSAGLLEEDQWVFEEMKGKRTFAVVNKIDLPDQKNLSGLNHLGLDGAATIYLSAKTREGIETLEKKISESILEVELNEESVVVTRLRHRRALEASLEALQNSFEAFAHSESLELVSLDLKQSIDALKEFVGEIYSEDLLDAIFREFCIGK